MVGQQQQSSSAMEMRAPDDLDVVEQQTIHSLAGAPIKGLFRSSRTAMIDEQHE
jgi:hypothetical protein